MLISQTNNWHKDSGSCFWFPIALLFLFAWSLGRVSNVTRFVCNFIGFRYFYEFKQTHSDLLLDSVKLIRGNQSVYHIASSTHTYVVQLVDLLLTRFKVSIWRLCRLPLIWRPIILSERSIRSKALNFWLLKPDFRQVIYTSPYSIEIKTLLVVLSFWILVNIF